MSLIFNYNSDIYEGKGEGFFYGNKNSALSFFRFPNTDGLKGIALHVHPDCDDIDVLIEGELLISPDWKTTKKIKAPALIANLAGTPHSILSIENKNCLMYGFRSPFRSGVEVKSADLNPAPNSTIKNKEASIYNLQSYSNGKHLIFESQYTKANLHKNVYSVPRSDEERVRVLINVSGNATLVGKSNEGRKSLNPTSFIHQDNKLEEILIYEEICLILELVAKGVNHES